MNPKATIRFSSRWPKSRKIRTTRAGFSRKWSITMIFGSSSWSMCSPISSVTVCTTPGSWACTLATTALRARERQVAPERRVLPLHDLLDHPRHLRFEDLHDVLGDLVRLELLVELLRRTELVDRLVHRDAAHLGGPRRHDPLPAEAALEDAGHLLQLARQHARELPHAGHRDRRGTGPGRTA